MSRLVLVTGGSRGIGKAISLALAQKGFEVVINYAGNHEAAELTLSEIQAKGGQARLLPFDVADPKACKEKLEALMEEVGPFWGAVINAGLSRDNPFPAIPIEDWDQVLRTNLDGAFYSLQPLIMPMVQARKGGRIVTISSLSGVRGNRGQAAYAASKAGLIGMAKSLALEMGKRKITVNCVAPGLIETEMIQDVDLEPMLKHIPLRRVGQADEVAALVDFLFSDGAGYITGQCISIDGGLS